MTSRWVRLGVCLTLVAGAAGTAAALSASAANANVMPTTQAEPGSAGAFIHQVYMDLLDRPPDASGLAFWQQQIAAGATNADVALAIETSAEAEADSVRQWYLLVLDRPGSAPEWATWVAALQSGDTPEWVMAQLVASPEFVSSHPGNALIVQAYEDLLDRTPTSGEVDQWAPLRGNPAAIASGLLTSQERLNRAVNGWYDQYLRRAASPAEAAAVVGALKAGETDDQAIANILGSTEYAELAAAGVS